MAARAYPKSVQIFTIFSAFHGISVPVRILPIIMLILKPKVQYFNVFLQYFASKISTSTEESVQLEALQWTEGSEYIGFFPWRRLCLHEMNGLFF